MAIARMAFAMRAAALIGTHVIDVPWPGAAVDFDFIRRRYWWGGAAKLEANFTTFSLGGATFGLTGLTPTDTTDITLTTAAAGGPFASMAVAYTTNSLPAAVRDIVSLDDATANNKCAIRQNTNANALGVVVWTGATQASIAVTNANSVGVKHGFGLSWAINQFDAAADNGNGTPDTLGNVPTVTRLQVGRSVALTSAATVSIARVVLFTTTKTLAELRTLAAALQQAL